MTTQIVAGSPDSPAEPRPLLNAERRVRDVVVIAASAGGFELIMRLAAALEPELRAVVVAVLHRSPQHDGHLRELVQGRCCLPVVEPQGGELCAAGTLYLAPRDRHLTLRRGCIWPGDGPKEHHTRPAANPLFRSAAAEYGPRVLGIVLSGGDSDGTSGCQAVLDAGGITLAQDPNEARDPSMPESTILGDAVTAVLPMSAIITAIHELAAGRAF